MFIKKSALINRTVSAAFAAAALAAFATPSQAVPSGYSLTWSDEFNQGVNATPNTANWNYDTGIGPNNDGWGNWEQETYVSDQAHCHIVADSAATDGYALQIQATKDSNGNIQSARLNTIGKVTPQYGYIEMRAKLPYGQGVWPSFWMLGTNMPTVGWPNCGEMDIMEMFGQNAATNMGSFHMGTPSARIDWTANYNLSSGIYNNAYHTFGLLWNSSGVTDYVDGVQYETHPSSSPGYAFNAPFYFIMNLAMGGTPPGNTNSTTVFPQNLLVDYVRLYEPTPTSGTTTTTDNLSNFNNVASKSANWAIDTSNPSYFNNQTGRADRTVDDTEYLTYNYSSISTFTAKVYTYTAAISTVSFLYSTNNGSTWTTAPINTGSRTASASSWGYYTITPSSALPSGVTNLKVQFTKSGNAYDPQLAQMVITHK